MSAFKAWVKKPKTNRKVQLIGKKWYLSDMGRATAILSFFLFSLSAALGQHNEEQPRYDSADRQVKEIEREALQKYSDDPKFDYEVASSEIGWWEDFKTWLANLVLRFFELIFGVEEAVGALAVFLRVLPYLLLVALLVLLIRFFIKVNAQSIVHAQTKAAFAGSSEEERIIKNENIKQLIANALADNNYRLAIRYYYLHILKLMTDKAIISWEIQKTNDDYLQEIRSSKLKRSFDRITRVYDYIWYGDFAIDQTVFTKIQSRFTALQKELGND